MERYSDTTASTQMGRRSVLRLLGTTGLAMGAVGGGSTALSQPAAAATGLDIDNFDDSDFSEYTFYRDGVATSTSNPTFSGSGALKIDGVATDCVSRSGLDAYPSRGDTFSVRVRWTAGAHAVIFAYGIQTYVEYADTEYYDVTIRPDSDKVVLKKTTLNGTSAMDKEFGVSLSPDTWYRIEVKWETDGTHGYSLRRVLTAGHTISRI